MQRPQPDTVTLDDVVITEELSRRSPRPPNLQAENQALHALARQLVNQVEAMLQSLVDMALDLCNAQSAGVSLLETTPTGEEIFRWNVLAGTLKQYVGNTAPRNFSPCGICLDGLRPGGAERGTPVLFSYPGRYFTYLQEAEAQIVEILVLPLIANNDALGTIWIVSHCGQQQFDPEDVRVMTSLADFTAAALLLNQRQTSELLAANATLEAEIVERKRAEELARERQPYFWAIVNLVPDMLWRNDSTGDTSWYNQRWLDYTGQTMEEAQGYGWLEVIHPGDRAQSLANFQNAVDERRPLRQEHRIRGTDGNYRWFQVQADPVFDSDGRIIQWFGAAIDIHEQRWAIEQSHESEERLRALIENLPGGAAFVVDRNLRYLLAEGEALYAAGFKREDLVGKTIFEVLPPELTAKYEEQYRKALLGESFEHEHNAHDRSYISRGMPLRSANGEVYAVLAVSYDISERKKAEVALRESEERFRLFVTASSDIIYRMSADWSQMRNLEGKNILASTEKPSHTWLETYIPKEEQPQVWAVIQEAIRTKSTFELEHRVIQQDGTIGWTFSRAIPMLNEQGEIIEWFGAASDVTDRKQAEAAIAQDLRDTQLLRDLSARLVTEGNIQALYQEILAAAIALTRADAGTVQILDEATQELVLLATQGFERNTIDRFHRVNASSHTPCGMALKSGDRIFVDFDVPESEDPDGSMRLHVEAGYLSAQSIPLIARSGKPIGMVSTHWRKHHRPSDSEALLRSADRELRFLDLLARQAADLIEQSQTQTALRESEERFRLFVTASSDIIYRMSADWSVMHNLEGKQFIASTTNPKRTWLDEYIPEDEQPQVWAAIESAIQTKSNFELEHRVFREDGTIGWTFSRAIPLLDEQGEIIEWFGAASNITDRKQAEAALRDSEEKYRTLFNSIDEGFCIFELIEDDEGNAIDWIYLEANPAFEQQTGFINPIGKRISEFQPDLERFWFERFACVARTGQPVRFVQYTEAMGIWYDVYALRVGVAGDNRVSLLFTDITDRKQAEATLHRNMDELKRLNRAMVNRELRMIELKKEVNKLCKQQGAAERYPLEFEQGRKNDV